MYQLDSSFKKAKLATAARRRRAALRNWAAGLGVVAAVAAITFVAFNPTLLWQWMWWRSWGPAGPGSDVAGDAPDVYVPAIVDLAGDPMKISLGDASDVARATRFTPRPEGVSAERVIGEIAILSDTMIAASQRFMTTLPSSPKDFAFYQSQRLGATAIDAGLEQPVSDTVAAAPAIEAGAPTFAGDESGGWGENLAGEQQALPDVAPTLIEDSTSVIAVRSDAERFQPDRDVKLRVLVKRSLMSLSAEAPFLEADLGQFDAAMKALINKDSLEVGDVVAVRGIRESAQSSALRVVQVSINSSTGYIATLSRADDGSVVLGADPWVDDNLFNYKGIDEIAQPGRQYRLLDAIYSTAVRNGVPTGALGEAIILLSRGFDLNAFASDDDRLVLAYVRDGAEGTAGRVLYVAISGTDRDIECFVFKAPSDSDYSCFVENSQGQTVSVSTPSGMITPVNGVLTSTFGPRMHPIFKEVRVHAGVDWAAPSGTPVLAAFAGEVVFAGDGSGYGNLLRIGHPDGRETRYAHLKAFATGMAPGKQVAAGELVGYVGTTGNSTGPHLHFELRLAGTAVDPLQAAMQQQAAVFVSDGTAVDELTERIVQVESGGSATAKNPLSSATGAGQFISTTWLRMMRTYRPDLANSMSEAALLDLRNDPTISREMVQNLAREGEAYLRARGHQITAGRLYLAHFLGMEGASLILSQDGATPLANVLSTGVMNANPFLIGNDVAWVIDWAERKMSGANPQTAAPTVQMAAPSPEFALYKEAIAALLQTQTTAIN